MTQSIIPRPIAWVLTSNSDQSFNLAPFSYFNAVASDPPLCMLSMGKKPTGEFKDTVVNLQLAANCVIHIANVDQSAQVTASAATLPYAESEIDKFNISLTTEKGWQLPRIEGCPIAFYGAVYKLQDLGNTPQRIVFVEIKASYIDDNCCTLDDKNRFVVNALQVNALARLGASQYSSLGEVFENERPK